MFALLTVAVLVWLYVLRRATGDTNGDSLICERSDGYPAGQLDRQKLLSYCRYAFAVKSPLS